MNEKAQELKLRLKLAEAVNFHSDRAISIMEVYDNWSIEQAKEWLSKNSPGRYEDLKYRKEVTQQMAEATKKPEEAKEASEVFDGSVPAPDRPKELDTTATQPADESELANLAVEEYENSPLAISGGFSIPGLEGITNADLPLPVIKIVHSQSENIETNDGQNAPIGHFYNSATKEASEEVKFTLLAARHTVQPSYSNPNVMQDTFILLGMMDEATEPFLMWVKSTAYRQFQNLLLSIKNSKAPAAWYFKIRAVTEERRNDKGQRWHVPKFYIEGKNDAGRIDFFSKMYLEFRESLTKSNDPDVVVEQ